MPNIASILKEEISRLARREIRGETARLLKIAASHRAEIVALKRRAADLERQAKHGAKESPPTTLGDAESGEKLRFRAQGFAKNRQRLALSAAEMGMLLGVSALSVYNWESGKAKPRRGNFPAIAALRGMGKREAAARLEELAAKG